MSIPFPKESVFMLGEKQQKNVFLFLFRIVRIAWCIARLCNQHDIWVSISHGDSSNILNIISKLFWNKAKIVIVLHNKLSIWVIWALLYLFCRCLYRFSDECIAVSKELAQEKDIIWHKHIRVIYNSFDFAQIKILSQAHIQKNQSVLFDSKKKAIGYIARLSVDKWQERMIDIFARFCSKHWNQYQLFIIGWWDQKFTKALRDRIELLGLTNVYLLGFQNNVYQFIPHFNYCMSLSEHEWFGRVLVDSLSLGVPCLVHDYRYGAKEIMRMNDDFSACDAIEIHNGWILIPFQDDEKCLEAMDLMFRMKFQASKIQESVRKFDKKVFYVNWKEIL